MDAENKEIKANGKYKDSVFCRLFSDKERFLELYGAICGKTFPKDTKMVETTLESALFMGRRNDVSFLIEDKLVVLMEHQSTVNENMPLRFLLYIAAVYEKLLDKSNVYREKLIKIPEPEFIVIYNGVKDYPAMKTLKLSDAFSGGSLNRLELKVNVININKAENSELFKKSESLYGYYMLIELIREYQKQGYTLEKAAEKAIKECKDKNLIKQFLTDNAWEVDNMLMTEFNIDDAKVIWREEALEEGREEGREEGIIISIKSLLQSGFSAEEISNYLSKPLSFVNKVKAEMVGA